MYNVKISKLGDEFIQKNLTKERVESLLSNLGKAKVKVLDTETNEVFRPVVTEYRVYWNTTTEEFFDNDDFVPVNVTKYKLSPEFEGYTAVFYNSKFKNFKPRFLRSPSKQLFRFSYANKELKAVYAKIAEGWCEVWTPGCGKTITAAIAYYDLEQRCAKLDSKLGFLKYKIGVIRRFGEYTYKVQQQKIFILNEVKGFTDVLKDKCDSYIPVRDAGRQIAMSLDSETAGQPAIIVTSYHQFSQELVDCNITISRTNERKTKTFIKESRAITLAQNLYNSGCPSIKLVDIRYDLKDAESEKKELISRSVTIAQGDDFWSKIQDFCELWDYRASRISEKIQKANEVKTLELSKEFKKYASVYGLEANSSENEELFRSLVNDPEKGIQFMDDKFICPHCGEIVHLNSHYIFKHGKYINTNQTICDDCGIEYDVHDIKDIRKKILKLLPEITGISKSKKVYHLKLFR